MELGTLQLVLLGTGATCLATVIGAAAVFVMKDDISGRFQQVTLGFAAGVMIAASVWSLLIPSIEQAEAMGQIGWIPAGAGFLLGGAFLLVLDKLLPHLHIITNETEGPSSSWKRTTMVVFAVTLHNIPEGMAVALAFAAAGAEGSTATLAGAVALALGMGLQNLPEGAAVSMPLRQEGVSKWKSFACGAFSGVVEPIAGLIAVFLAGSIVGIMPWCLSFAAGAMIYVVAEELIPEAAVDREGKQSHAGTIGVMVGFLLMMVLDVAIKI